MTSVRLPLRPLELGDGRVVRLRDGGTAPASAAWDMFLAAHRGDLAGVASLEERHAGLCLYEYNYTPPLHFAAREGHAPVVVFLLDRGADATYRSYPFLDDLWTLASERDHAAVTELLGRHLRERFPWSPHVAPLLEAAAAGNVARVDAELAVHAGIASGSDLAGDTALHRAAGHGHAALVRHLLQAGAPVDAVRGDGWRPVHSALMPAREARVAPARAAEVATILLAAGARQTPFVAAMLGDRRAMETMLAEDASLANAADTCHRRPISAAAERGDLGLVELLLAHGADPNLPEAGAERGHALWRAVWHGHVDVVRALLARGADPNGRVESSGTAGVIGRQRPELWPLLVAAGAKVAESPRERFAQAVGDGDQALVRQLLDADPTLVDDPDAAWGEGILAGPSNGADLGMVELLLDRGARVPSLAKWGPEYYGKHVAVLRRLLERGMDPDHGNWHRTRLLHHAAARGAVEKVALLLEHGATLDAIDDEYRSTPLGFAARWGQVEVARLLLTRGADRELAGAAWATPRAWAGRRGHASIMDLL